MSYKAQAAMRYLVDDLKKRVSATLPVCTESFDSNENPVAVFSADASPAAGEKVVVMRMKSIPTPGAKDAIGLTAQSYSHHVIQICTEANFAGATDNVADILGPVELLPVLIDAGRQGSYVEWYVTANGTVPSVAAIDAAAAPAATWRDLYFGVKKAQ